jgi:hypothetical protein
MNDKIKNEKGVVMIFVVVAMVAIIGMAALAIDFGNAAVRKSRLQNACDSAALAGAQALTDTHEAGLIAKDIFRKNIQENMNNASITDPTISFAEGDRKIIVEAHEDFDTYFAGIFGMNKMAVNTDAAAVRGPVAGISGLRPFGIDVETWNNYEPLTSWGALDITLELGPGTGTSGNYNLITLDSTGAAEVEDNIRFGCEEKYSIDDIINTATGVKVGPVREAVEDITDEYSGFYPDYYNDEYDGFIICPIVTPADGSAWEDITGTTPMRIVEFAVVQIDDYTNKEITGTIVNYYDDVIVNGEVDLNASDHGIYAINLVE